jgi:tetratricopeptide (TPR) repeat protein
MLGCTSRTTTKRSGTTTGAIRLDSTYADAYLRRGFAWFFKGHYDQAIRDCDQAIRLDPNCEQAYELRTSAQALKTGIQRDDTAERVQRIKGRLRVGVIKAAELEQIMGRRPDRGDPIAPSAYIPEFKRSAGISAYIMRYFPFEVPGVAQPRYRVNLLFQNLADGKGYQLTSWYFRSPN